MLNVSGRYKPGGGVGGGLHAHARTTAIPRTRAADESRNRRVGTLGGGVPLFSFGLVSVSTTSFARVRSVRRFCVIDPIRCTTVGAEPVSGAVIIGKLKKKKKRDNVYPHPSLTTLIVRARTRY